MPRVLVGVHQRHDVHRVPRLAPRLALHHVDEWDVTKSTTHCICAGHEQARGFLNRLKVPVCPYTLGHRAVFGDAGAVGLAAQEYDSRGKGAAEILQVYKYVLSTLVQLSKDKTKQEHHEQQAEFGTAAG